MPRLFIVEQVTPGLLEMLAELEKETHLLLMSPSSVWAFKNKPGIVVHYAEDFLSSNRLNQLGMDNMALAKRITSKIDHALFERYPEFDKKGLKFAFYHVDRFKIAIDSLFMRICLLHEVFLKLKPSIVYYYDEPEADIDISLIFRSSIFSLAVPIVASYFDIRCESYPANFSPSKKKCSQKNEIKSVLRSVYQGLTSFLDTLSSVRFVFHKKSFRILSINASYDQNVILKDPKVLEQFEVWRWHSYIRGPFGSVISAPSKISCKNRVTTRNIKNFYIQNPRYDDWDEKLLERLYEKVSTLCEFEGLNWFELLKDRIAYFLNYIVPQCYDLYNASFYLAQELKPHLGVYNAGVKNAQEGAIIKGLKDNGARFAMVQHGGGGYGLISVPAVDTRDFEQVPGSHYICWGDGVKQFFKYQAQKNKVNMVPAGSQIIQNIRSRKKKRCDNNIRTVYYILNNYRYNFNYYPGGQHFTDTWYFKLHLDVISIFSRFLSYDFVLKVPPTFGELDLYKNIIRETGNISIKTTKLTNIINDPDLYIIDSLSTTIIQAAATSIPIIVYSGEHCKTPNPEAVKLLGKRAICSSSRSDFLNNIQTVLEDPSKMSANSFDSEFIEGFGIGNPAGKQDWASTLNQIVTQETVLQ